jgi:uncharacterized protein YnzC (UPF0291/DUF896 family)
MPGVFRNNLVFANNKRQNIEYRLFATGSAQLRTGSLAIAYSSFFNKFISDLPTQDNQINTNYFASQSKASSTTYFLLAQNTRSIYLQNYLDILSVEYSSTASLNETSSNTQLLNTNYFASQSKANSATYFLLSQNTRSIYLQNYLDILTVEFPNSSSLNETGSNTLLLRTNYYASQSKASNLTINLTYQNTRSIYLQTYDLFIQEFASTASLNETGSNTLLLRTNYYASQSKASNITINLTYQNTRSIYLQTYDLFIQEFAGTASLNDTSSNTLLLRTNYYASQSKTNPSLVDLSFQNTRSIYLQNYDILIREISLTSGSFNDTGSTSVLLNTNYYASESKASNLTINLTYQNTRSLYLENSDIFIAEYTLTSSFLNDTGSYTLLLSTNYYASESKASNSTINLTYQNTRSLYLENSDIFVAEYAATSSFTNDTGSYTLLLNTNYYVSESVASVTSDNLTYQNSRSLYLENLDIFIREN